jgi:hypothetical protein
VFVVSRMDFDMHPERFFLVAGGCLQLVKGS